MTKSEFLNTLADALYGLPQDEINKTTQYYSEIIADAIEEGEDEEEVITRLGDIKEIAQKVINTSPLTKFVQEKVNKPRSNTTKIILIVTAIIWVPLLIGLIVTAFCLYLSIWAVLISLFATVLGLFVSGIVSTLGSLFFIVASPIKAMFTFGAGLALIGISIFIFYFSVWLSKLLVNLTLRLFKGGIRNEKAN